MKSFSEFIKEGKVLRKSPDHAEARSLLYQAQQRMKDLFTLSLQEENAPFRFEDAYEVLREVMQSFLALSGYKPYSHEAVFIFGYEERIISEAEFRKADRYREIRNDISYRGASVQVEEVKEIILFVKKILPRLQEEFQKRGG